MIKDVVERNVHAFTSEPDQKDWNLQGLLNYLHGNLLPEGVVTLDDLKGKEQEEIISNLFLKK